MLKNCINFLKSYKNLLLVVSLAIVLRFWSLSNNPPSLNWDEVSHGYNAYSILKTGNDEWGQTLPVIFRAYGDYKLPIYIYLTALSEFIFGLTPFAVRLVSALAGVGTVVMSYFLASELFFLKKDARQRTARSVPIVVSLLVAIEPWTLFLSRAAFEANLGLFFFVLGIYCFLKFVNSLSSKYLLLTTVFLGLTVWTYNSYRIFTPLITVVLVFLFFKELKLFFRSNLRMTFMVILTTLLFFIPMAFQLLSTQGQARYSWVGILDKGAIAHIEQVRNSGGSKIVNNRYVYFAFNFAKNYISHFSPKYLFLEGGSDYQFNVQGWGLLYLINLPLFYLGLVYLFLKVLKSMYEKTTRNRRWWLIIFWIILSPIPSSLTREAPHVLRDVTFLPVPMILTAFGFKKLYDLLLDKKNYNSYIIYGYGLAWSVLLLSYIKVYFVNYRQEYSSSWQYGYKQVMKFVKSNYFNYDRIIITKKYGEPHEFLLFDFKWSPDNYFNNPTLKRFYKTEWYWVDSFDKFYFVNDWEISENDSENLPRSQPNKDIFKLESGSLVDCRSNNSNCLLITSPGNFPNGWNKLETIYFLNKKPAFELYEN